jgi:peptidoglycan/LPS O-acetylase OafA/YrhL
MRAVWVLLLVLVVLLTGMPFGMAMADTCPACPASAETTVTTACAAMVSAFLLLVVGSCRRRPPVPVPDTGVLLSRAFDHPPRS